MHRKTVAFPAPVNPLVPMQSMAEPVSYTHLDVYKRQDGTPVRTAAQQRKKRICDCKENGCSACNCKRHYSGERYPELLGVKGV